MGQPSRSRKRSTASPKASTATPRVPARRAGRQSKLTPETEAKVLELIRKGCFATVAVAAAGAGYTSFKRWMNRKDRRGRAFQRAVEQARAEARASREAAVFTEDPLAWLRLGPGRDLGPDEPGWTERPAPPSRVEHTGPGGGPIAHALTAQVVRSLTVILDPEARRLACELLERVASREAEGDPALAGAQPRASGGAHGGDVARAALAGGAGALRLEGALEARPAPGPAEPGAP